MLDFVVKLQVLVCRPAAPRRTSARPAHKHAQSRRSAAGPRCRGRCGRQVRASGAPPPRDGLVRRGRDRVRGGATSNDVFGVDRLASWRADGVTLHSVVEAGRRGLAAVFSPRKHPMAAAGAVFGPREGQPTRRQPSWGHRLASRRVQGTQRIV